MKIKLWSFSFLIVLTIIVFSSSNITAQAVKAKTVEKQEDFLSPDEIRIRQEHWTTILAQTNKSDAQKNEELDADIREFLTVTKNSPIAIMTVLQKFDHLKNEAKRDFYENLILRKFPNTKYDETVLSNRINREDYKKFSADSLSTQELESLNRKLIAMRWVYIKRPVHFNESDLGYVYSRLFEGLAETKDATDNQLTDLIQGTLKYDKSPTSSVNSYIARTLAENMKLRPGSRLNEDAEKYARAGIIEAENKIKMLGDNDSTGKGKILRGRSLNDLAYVLVQDGKLDEAEQVLLKVEQIPKSKIESSRILAMREDTNYVFARLYTAKKDFKTAEQYYLVDALNDSYTKKRFAEFYEEQYATKNGFDKYYIGIQQKIKVRLRERVIATRIENPQEAAPFSLKTVDSKTISSADLVGKIIVINVWGTWCGPCVGEMPQFQQLYKKYENDKEVAIITIDVNDEIETLKKFMADRKYEFPVLLGDDYKENIRFDGATAFPTTLFISKQNKVSFVKLGDSDNLVEEYAWRIETLKQDK